MLQDSNTNKVRSDAKEFDSVQFAQSFEGPLLFIGITRNGRYNFVDVNDEDNSASAMDPYSFIGVGSNEIKTLEFCSCVDVIQATSLLEPI
ncbi:hypothetical protein SARC_06033 [Sphaeroforma arctica JP610]|uniref:Uncharacterized protein n=1 Tax=Sphaeroforma arctica JP610 TaxID=667725 RepID=A0A0L0FYM0_9EUKA|nr:hypothetical protein SARC_06033 [Sphaeroforma arctica JP610]KNC81646.1 hypothetical protein SARC_06033 [Sphaeroforma arctica JP610]|eukprot:XP_014155548.1 hypothetical protein SARC_06033 [Sphaeroforma arctica JP610]